ncbi:MAG TPA: nuclear transport factor 2 family protein [Actinoallomurus sp.]|jgi:hypothetical protein|nr:nuclear transport factor 2 family protein [Actinoallomurus sp.]
MSQVLSQWKAAFDGHRPAAMAELFADGALFQGFGPEPTSGRDVMRAYYAAVPADLTAEVEILHTYTVGETVAGGFADVAFRGDDGYEVPVHLSLVLVRDGDTWRIQQYHVSRIITERCGRALVPGSGARGGPGAGHRHAGRPAVTACERGRRRYVLVCSIWIDGYSTGRLSY